MKNRTLVVGGAITSLGLILIPFLSIYSIFVAIPIIIIGTGVTVSALVKLSRNKIAIGSSSVLGAYYLGIYWLLITSNALT